MTLEEKTLLVRQLVTLALENMEVNVKSSVDEKEMLAALDQMANNVVDQILALPDNEKLIVSMATMTKLLVENFVLQRALKNV
jgi:hypothetical protein